MINETNFAKNEKYLNEIDLDRRTLKLGKRTEIRFRFQNCKCLAKLKLRADVISSNANFLTFYALDFILKTATRRATIKQPS